jgi:hypothetical protein
MHLESSIYAFVYSAKGQIMQSNIQSCVNQIVINKLTTNIDYIQQFIYNYLI